MMSARKHRRENPLPTAAVLRRISQMLALVEKDLKIGLEVRASLDTANNLIRSIAMEKPYPAASCVNSIQGSQAMYLSLTLAKLFELPRPRKRQGETHARRYNRSDAASIPLLVRLVRQKRAQALLIKRARSWTPQLKSLSEKHAADCKAAIEQAITAYDSTIRTKSGRNAMLRLRSFRNNLLAHSLLNAARRIRPTYAEIFLLTDAARAVVKYIKLAVQGQNMSDAEQFQIRIAKTFWNAALPAAMKAELFENTPPRMSHTRS